MKIKIFTDGACSGNQSDKNYGGWGAVLKLDLHEKEIYGGEADTTNNRMELTGVIEAFSALKKPNLSVDVYTDSAYIANCFKQKWYVGWRRSGWLTSSKKPVENRDLWEKLLSLVEEHNVRFLKVKGHVNLNSSEATFEKLYQKFLSDNSLSRDEISLSDFKAVIEMNILADTLAVRGANEVKAINV